MQRKGSSGRGRGGTRDISADRRESKGKRAVNIKEQKDRHAEIEKKRLQQQMRADLKRLSDWKRALEDLARKQDEKASLDRKIERKLFALVSQVEKYLDTGRKPDIKALDGAIVYVAFLITLLARKIRTG